MSPKDEDFIRFYRDAVIAGHNEPAAETMRSVLAEDDGRLLGSFPPEQITLLQLIRWPAAEPHAIAA